jgi:hypothetical protein
LQFFGPRSIGLYQDEIGRWVTSLQRHRMSAVRGSNELIPFRGKRALNQPERFRIANYREDMQTVFQTTPFHPRTPEDAPKVSARCATSLPCDGWRNVANNSLRMRCSCTCLSKLETLGDPKQHEKFTIST